MNTFYAKVYVNLAGSHYRITVPSTINVGGNSVTGRIRVPWLCYQLVDATYDKTVVYVSTPAVQDGGSYYPIYGSGPEPGTIVFTEGFNRSSFDIPRSAYGQSISLDFTGTTSGGGPPANALFNIDVRFAFETNDAGGIPVVDVENALNSSIELFDVETSTVVSTSPPTGGSLIGYSKQSQSLND